MNGISESCFNMSAFGGFCLFFVYRTLVRTLMYALLFNGAVKLNIVGAFGRHLKVL